ncbi:hypothetical protein AN958_04948 [Leucoagaricus sp. SymC.cos]|nr:hypothetical protein AN958_04948 [Leucoagaricus sp. SymC.cos]
MMDRHLIYPPNWDKKKKGSDWDADPSLKGKTVSIQGTSIVLNTPEALDTWLAERKKRWPTAQRVEEKNKKMEEAIARGQLPLKSSMSQGMKRRREEGHDSLRNRKRPHKSASHRDAVPTKVAFERTQEDVVSPFQHPPVASKDSVSVMVSTSQLSDGDESDSGDSAPEVASSKPTGGQDPPIGHESRGVAEESIQVPEQSSTPGAKPPQPQKREPRLPPRNPFASRPTLLRNLLAPEIRMTVSNLSQAIRFLVDNDFLRNVELRPGQAEHHLIEVLDSNPPASGAYRTHHEILSPVTLS